MSDVDKPLRVLIVDDEPAVRMGLQAFLRRAECEVTAAESGTLAIQLLAQEEFDVALLDMRMPETLRAGTAR